MKFVYHSFIQSCFHLLIFTVLSSIQTPAQQTISGNVTIPDGTIVYGNFAVSAYPYGTTDVIGVLSVADTLVNADGTYTLNLSKVDPSITQFIVAFYSTEYRWELYDNVPVSNPEDATPVSRGATAINAHLERNVISGTVTASDVIPAGEVGVAVFHKNSNSPNDLSLASSEVNTDGSYSVDLTGVDPYQDTFKVMFMSNGFIWEYYDDVSYTQPEKATLVTRGSQGIDAYLVSNYISGTITAEDEFIHTEFGVAVFDANNVINDITSDAIAWGNVNSDGTYVVDLSVIPDKSIKQFKVLFASNTHIWEFYNDVPAYEPENAAVVSSGSTGIDAHMNTNTIKGTISAEGEGVVISDQHFGVGVYAPDVTDILTAQPLAFSEEMNPDGSYVIDVSKVDATIHEFIVYFVSSKHIYEIYNDLYYWEDINQATLVRRGATGINAHLDLNIIEGNITLDTGNIVPEEIDVAVYSKLSDDPLNQEPAIYSTEIFSDGSYIVDLSGSNMKDYEFKVLFNGLKYILEFYDDVPWQQPEQSTLVKRGAEAINAHLIYDRIPPELIVEDLVRNNDPGEAGAVVKLTAETYDNSGHVPLLEFIPASGHFFPLGITEVVVKATDGAGNQTSKTMSVTIMDAEPPEIHVEDIVVFNDPGQPGASVIYEVTVTDNSGEVPVANCSHQSGDFFPLGTTVITCKTEDSAGNQAQDSFKVTVVDNEPPIISIPPDTSLQIGEDYSPAITGFASATDNSNVAPTITHIDAISDHPDVLIINIIEREWSALDTSDNKASGIQVIYITPLICPEGYYAPIGSTECIPAPIDHYVDTEGAFSPTPCPDGSYQDQTGQTFCIYYEICDGVDNDLDGLVDEGFDVDNDGIADCFDTEECDGIDNDGDGLIDEGFDADSDGIADCFDECPEDPNKIIPGLCGCGIPDDDTDEDGVINCIDNCPGIYNPGQEDLDEDGLGDLCDSDIDLETVVENLEELIIVGTTNFGIRNSLLRKIDNILKKCSSGDTQEAINTIDEFILQIEDLSGKQISTDLANELIGLALELRHGLVSGAITCSGAKRFNYHERISTNLQSNEPVKIYPNPFQDRFYIRNLTEGLISYQVFTPDGKMIVSEISGSEVSKIDCPMEVHGLLIVVVNSSMGSSRYLLYRAGK